MVQDKNGVYKFKWGMFGKEPKWSTFFPSDWTRQEVVKKILEARKSIDKYKVVFKQQKEGNFVLIGWFVDPDFDEYPDPNAYKTTVNEFLNMISAWFRLHKERPNKIILEVESEKIRLYREG